METDIEVNTILPHGMTLLNKLLGMLTWNDGPIIDLFKIFLNLLVLFINDIITEVGSGNVSL